MRWAQVTQVSPVRVQLNGDTTPLPYEPPTAIDATFLSVDDMVMVERVDSLYVIVGRSQGDPGGFIGEHRAGEWATPPHPAWVLANGAVLNIADYPKLAAHYASTYGTSNHHGGNGTTTFAVPDTRERTYVNQGGSDVFADLGSTTGAKTHQHDLSDGAWAYIRMSNVGELLASRRISIPGWTTQFTSSLSGVTTGGTGSSLGTPLGGETESASNVPPSFVCKAIIRAR